MMNTYLGQVRSLKMMNKLNTKPERNNFVLSTNYIESVEEGFKEKGRLISLYFFYTHKKLSYRVDVQKYKIYKNKRRMKLHFE